MKHLILISLVVVGLSSCAPTSPTVGPSTPAATASDSLVVTAEKTLRTAKDTFDLFLHLEYDNRATLERVSPDIHKYAEYIRKNAPDWLTTANNLKNSYKHSRTPENQATLMTALTTITEAVTQSQKYITQAAKVGP